MQQGITLIEILFTIFLMSIGLLGLSAVQLKTMNHVTSSHFKTEANYYLQDMAERIRANQAESYNGIDNNTSAGATLASQDGAQWIGLIEQAEADGGLPAGATGTVDLAGSIYTITISWDEVKRDGGDGSAKDTITFTLKVRV